MRRVLAIAAVATLVLSTSASAQRRASSATSTSSADMPVELGLDAALLFGLGNNSYTAFVLPVSQARVGFFVSPELELEPYGSFLYGSNNAGSSSDLTLGIGALYHFSTSRAMNQVYVRPFIALEHSSVSVSGGNSTSSNGGEIGAGVGIKLPWVDRLAWRFEGNLSHSLNSGGGNQIGILAGLSYFTK